MAVEAVSHAAAPSPGREGQRAGLGNRKGPGETRRRKADAGGMPNGRQGAVFSPSMSRSMKQDVTNAKYEVVWPTNPNATVPKEHTTSPPRSICRCPNLHGGPMMSEMRGGDRCSRRR